MRIDIYSIILFQLSTIIFVYQLAFAINKVSDEEIRREFKKLRSDYDGAISLGDIVVWPILLTIIFPFYILLRLIIKKMFIKIIVLLANDRSFLFAISIIFIIFMLLVIFLLLRWYVPYFILFILSSLHIVLTYRKEKREYESR